MNTNAMNPEARPRARHASAGTAVQADDIAIPESSQ
jgi:hypothetical protein